MKKKNAFTLIELLAVIVILAIIALIVTPVVSNIVSNANNAANARSVEGHIKNIEYAIISKAFEDSTGDMTTYDTGKTAEQIEELVTADNDNVTCESYKIQNGTVISAMGCTDSDNQWGKMYKYTNELGAYVFEFNGTVIWPGLDSNGNPTQDIISSTLSLPLADSEGNSIVKYLGIVYMDPSDIKTVCNQSSTITTTNKGCKKFYIYSYDDTTKTYKMIMDRNIGSNIAWANNADYIAAGGSSTEWSSNKTKYGPVTIVKELKNTVAKDWVGSPDILSADELAEIVGAASADTIAWNTSKSFTTSSPSNTGSHISTYYLDGGRNENPEVYAANSNGWKKQYCTTQNCSLYAWLYNYTSYCASSGCNIEANEGNGYWLKESSGHDANGNYIGEYAYVLYYQGMIGLSDVSANANGYRIRPVLTIEKSILS